MYRRTDREYIRAMAEAMAVNYDSNPNIRVFVNLDDHDHEPHFHVQVGQLTNGRWKADYETRIRLDKAEYLSNQEKDRRLPYDIIQWLDDELMKPNISRHRNDEGHLFTKWEFACDTWNVRSFTNKQFTPPDEQPDYSSLQSSDSVISSRYVDRDYIRAMAMPIANNYDTEPNIRVFVNEDDHDHEPHFHVQVGKLINGKWKAEYETRIRLDKAEYYSSSKKDKRLPYEILEWIDSEMSRLNGRKLYNADLSNWEVSCLLWNSSYTNKQFTPPNEQPDYSSLQIDDDVTASSDIYYSDLDDLKISAEKVVTEESLLLIDSLNRSLEFEGRKGDLTLISVTAEDLNQNLMNVNIEISNDEGLVVESHYILSFYGMEPRIEAEPNENEVFMMFIGHR